MRPRGSARRHRHAETSVEALAAVRDILTDLPHLPELPQRGPGADLIGRGAALLVDLPVELQPHGWRLVDSPGRDARRAASWLRSDLDALAEAFDGYAGPLKVQVAGPWTLAASLWLPRGERALTDPGARREVVESLAAGVVDHLAAVRSCGARGRDGGAARRAVPDRRCWPGGCRPRPATAGSAPSTRSRPSRAWRRCCAPSTRPVPARVLHCCAPDVPIALLARAGAAGPEPGHLVARRRAAGSSSARRSRPELRLWAGAVPTVATPDARGPSGRPAAGHRDRRGGSPALAAGRPGRGRSALRRRDAHLRAGRREPSAGPARPGQRRRRGAGAGRRVVRRLTRLAAAAMAAPVGVADHSHKRATAAASTEINSPRSPREPRAGSPAVLSRPRPSAQRSLRGLGRDHSSG